MGALKSDALGLEQKKKRILEMDSLFIFCHKFDSSSTFDHRLLC